MTFSLAACLLLAVPNADPTSFGWRYNRVEDLYREFSGASCEAQEARTLLNKILQNAVDQDEKLYARWRLACWEFRCGDAHQGRQMLEKALEGADKNCLITFRIHYDLGDFYTEAWQTKLASTKWFFRNRTYLPQWRSLKKSEKMEVLPMLRPKKRSRVSKRLRFGCFGASVKPGIMTDRRISRCF